MILIIAAQDLRRLFLSPLAWVLLAIAQGLLAWIFLVLVDDFQNLQDRLGLLDNAPGITGARNPSIDHTWQVSGCTVIPTNYDHDGCIDATEPDGRRTTRSG